MTSTVTLAIAGDVMLGRIVDTTMATRGPREPWGDMLGTLSSADALLINLECALTNHREEWTDASGRRKTFYFRSDPATASECLRAANVTCASLANNHAGDYGARGLLDTVATLDAAGILHAGAGSTIAEASRPAMVLLGDQRCAVVAFADHPEGWAADEHSPGINWLPEVGSPAAIDRVSEAIAGVRGAADLVICSLHWGPNMRAVPTMAFRSFAHAVIDAGADILFGHSAHVVQGVEIYAGKPILYDTGDFVDDYAVDPALTNDLSALFLLRVTDGRVARAELVPVEIARCQVNHATPPARDWFADRFRSLCKAFGTRVVDDGDHLRIDVDTADSARR